MIQFVVFLGLAAAVMVLAYRWRSLSLQRQALQRFSLLLPSAEPEAAPERGSWRPFPRRHWVVPWLVAAGTAVGLHLVANWPAIFSCSAALIVGLLGFLVESYWAAQMVVRIEVQLADAIDLIVGALEAGASVSMALQAAADEIASPLRPHLEIVIGRIRLGDDPDQVYRTLAERVPLETFLLFSSALGVHSEVGGRLAPTLVTVSRTIRDRIDISRRIRSNAAYSQISTVAVLGLTYFIAAVVWRNSPDRMGHFLQTSIGSSLVAGSMLLQAIGIVWMSAVSRLKF